MLENPTDTGLLCDDTHTTPSLNIVPWGCERPVPGVRGRAHAAPRLAAAQEHGVPFQREPLVNNYTPGTRKKNCSKEHFGSQTTCN